MLTMLKFEWYRMTHSISFLTALILSCALSFTAAAEQFAVYLQGMDHISVFYRWIGQFNLTFGSQYLFTLIPLLTSLAYSHSGCTDRKQGYIYQIVSRTGRRNYFTAKYLVSFAGGGIVFAAAVLFNFILLAMFMPAEIPDPVNMTSFIDQFRFCPQLYYTKPFLFSFLWLIVVFLWGGVMSVTGLLTGMFTANHLMAVTAPFLIFISEGVIGAYIMRKKIFFMGGYSLELIWSDMLYSGTPGAAPSDYIFMTIGIMLLVTSLVYWVRVRRYECL